jgi:hypothetical protein
MQNIDRRIIFLLLAVAVGFPLVKPLGMPLSIRSWTRTSYELVSGLKPGEIVMLSTDYGVGMQADIHDQVIAIFDQLMRQNVRVIGVSFNPQGARFLNGFIKQYEARGKKYGVDFAEFGYVAGGEAGLSAFMGDVVKTCPKDARGNDPASLPIMSGIKNLGNCRLFLGFCDGVPGGREYVRQLTQYKVPLVVGTVTVSATEFEPYVQSKQMAGLIPGLRGAAEYEMLSGRPGNALAGMDAQSAGHMVIILSVILCNVGLLATRSKKAK